MKTKKLNILYEDKYFIIINKPAGLLTIATEKEKEKTLYHYVYEYLKNKHKSNKVFIVHRLDKETSGIVMFAKDLKMKEYIQTNWNKVDRQYVAVVYGKMKNKKDRIKKYLMETNTHLTYCVNDKNGKLAITSYEVILENKKYSLLSLHLETGRKNQIRVSLSNIGNPIVGDKKYGIKKDPIRRMALHANYLKFYHPILNKEIVVDIDIPSTFIDLLKS